jgi:hypothetical protein
MAAAPFEHSRGAAAYLLPLNGAQRLSYSVVVHTKTKGNLADWKSALAKSLRQQPIGDPKLRCVARSDRHSSTPQVDGHLIAPNPEDLRKRISGFSIYVTRAKVGKTRGRNVP